jgi:hypothetical protein
LTDAGTNDSVKNCNTIQNERPRGVETESSVGTVMSRKTLGT